MKTYFYRSPWDTTMDLDIFVRVFCDPPWKWLSQPWESFTYFHESEPAPPRIWRPPIVYSFVRQTFITSYDFLMQSYAPIIWSHTNSMEFYTTFLYFHYYFSVKMQMEVWIILKKHLIFSSIFCICAKIEHILLNVVFMNFFNLISDTCSSTGNYHYIPVYIYTHTHSSLSIWWSSSVIQYILFTMFLTTTRH